MSESEENRDAVRLADQDLNDLVATVRVLVSQSREQSLTLARLANEQPTPGNGQGNATPQEAPSSSEAGEVSSPFLLAREGRAYERELDALTRWVDDLLLPVYGREVHSTRPWCRQWHLHPEAVARLHALWLAWQQFTDAEAGLAGPSLWHRDHLDPAMLQLRSPDGPLSACTTSPSRPNHRLLPAPDPTAFEQAA